MLLYDIVKNITYTDSLLHGLQEDFDYYQA